MNTQDLLLALYEKPMIPVEDVARDYFAVSNQVFLRKVDDGSIDLPVVKMEESQKAAKFVHIADLAEYIDARSAEARRDRDRLHH